MRETQESFGSPGKRPFRLSHAAPSLVDFHMLPSSVPAKSRPGFRYDSESATTVPNVSAPVASIVTPPVHVTEVSILAQFFFERSGEMSWKSSPRLSDFSTRLPAK